MVSINEIRNGLTLLVEGGLYVVVSFEHVKPGKGAAFVKVKLRSLKQGNVIERTYKSNDKLEDAFIEQKKLQYSYRVDNMCHFMDMESYEEVAVNESLIEDDIKFLKENSDVNGSFYEGSLISITPPMFVELKVTHTEPGIKGDTAKSGTKPAEVETGAIVQVPLFVDTDNVIKIDTRTGTYVERVTT